MFELCKYLDSKRLRNNYLDSSKLIKIYRIGKDKAIRYKLDKKEITIYNEMKAVCSANEWIKLDLILEEFNDNWNNRSEFQSDLEKLLNKGLYKEADSLYLNNIGCLKYASQYIILKTRYFSKCEFFSYLKELDFKKSEQLYKQYCNEDMYHLYKNECNKAIVNVKIKINKYLDNNDFIEAKNIYNRYKPYMNETSFDNYLSQKKQQLRSIAETTIHNMVRKPYLSTIENYFRKNYPNIPFSYIKEIFFNQLSITIINTIVDFRFEDSEKLFNKFKRYLSREENLNIFHTTISRLLLSKEDSSRLHNALKAYVIFFKKIDIEHSDYANTFKEIVSNTGISYNKDLLEYKDFVCEFLYSCLEKGKQKEANLAFQINKDTISRNEYDLIRKSDISKQIKELEYRLPDSIQKAREIFNKNADILNKSDLDNFEKQYQHKLKERNIHTKIDTLIEKLNLLSSVYIGIDEQTKIKDQLLDELRKTYLTDKQFFTDLYIDKVETIKESFDPRNYKSLFPNVELKTPQNVEDAVFFNKEKYYIASFIDYDKNSTHYKVKPYKSEQEIVNTKDLIIIGTLIRGSYHSHCYNCKEPIDGGIQLKCPTCNWYICSYCEACGCGYSYSYSGY
ncbi:MAG: hypothetical protein FH758_08105 [Firmicutes bacterium]|nr:hypothetical protein [Bacillota bacterium]